MNDQRSLQDQLDDLIDVAMSRGMYDAADFLARQAPDRFVEDDVIYFERPIDEMFGLTYANYFVVPRSILQSMSVRWQKRFVILQREMAALFGPLLRDDYVVQVRGKDGRFVEDDLAQYRHRGRIDPLK